MDSSAPTVTQPVQPDGGAPPSLASAPDTKPPRELKDPKHKETLSTSAISTSAVVEKDVVKGRKGSEPPPSLQALFTRDMGSSRRWANRPFSTADTDIGNIHLKQHSFDSSHLQSLSPQSPKLYMRRVKSPSVSDKNTRGGVEMTLEGLAEGRRDSEGSSGGGGGKDIGLHRTPSHPHLNSATSSPQVSRHASAHTTDPTAQPPIARAHSSQQLKLEVDNDERVQLNNRLMKSSSGGSNTDLSHPHLSEIPSGLKLMKDRELSQSKESMNSPKDLQFSAGNMKRTASRESLKGGKESTGFSKVIQPKETIVSTSNTTSAPVPISCGSVGVSPQELNKENRERTAPSKDTQSSAEGSVESLQAPVFQLVSVRVYVCV